MEDLGELAKREIQKADAGKLGSSLVRKLKLFAWETGLGPVMNAVPSAFGQQAVLYFPGRSGKFSCPCMDQNGLLIAAVSKDDADTVRENLLRNPGVEVWLKNGWFAGAVRLLTDEEKEALAASVSDAQFFGSASGIFGEHSLKDSMLLEITRSAPCTGSDGPGSKAWVWPLAALFILFTKKNKR